MKIFGVLELRFCEYENSVGIPTGLFPWTWGDWNRVHKTALTIIFMKRRCWKHLGRTKLVAKLFAWN